jgi:hypothetical protein
MQKIFSNIDESKQILKKYISFTLCTVNNFGHYFPSKEIAEIIKALKGQCNEINNFFKALKTKSVLSV